MEPAQIGIRELRQGLSGAIRRVRAGETLVVTDHGHPVARLAPIPSPDVLDRLIAEGTVRPPRRPTHPLPMPTARPVIMSTQEALDIQRGE